MNPTAEDYKTRLIDEICAAEDDMDRVKIAMKFMEEYSRLKSKEAADKAWEAGVKHGFDPEQFHSTADAKETFMKELFKDHG